MLTWLKYAELKAITGRQDVYLPIYLINWHGELFSTVAAARDILSTADVYETSVSVNKNKCRQVNRLTMARSGTFNLSISTSGSGALGEGDEGLLPGWGGVQGFDAAVSRDCRRAVATGWVDCFPACMLPSSHYICIVGRREHTGREIGWLVGNRGRTFIHCIKTKYKCRPQWALSRTSHSIAGKQSTGWGGEPSNKQRVLMHRHQRWNVRHGLCHIYMRYIYIYELFMAFVCFVVCSLL